MPTISEPAIRLFGGFTQDQLIDLLTSAAPSLWRGTDVVFQIGLGQGGIQSVANIQSLTLEVKELTNKIGAPLVTKTVTSFDDTTTQETWNAGTAQHALIALTNEDTSIPAGTYWLVLSVVTTDNPARIYTAGGTILAVTEDGAQGGGDAPYFTQGQSDARYALKGWAAKSAAYDLVAGDLILADTSGGAFTLTLPAAPNVGDQVAIEDAGESFSTNNLSVDPGGNKIESTSGVAAYSTDSVRLYFVWVGGGIGWRVVTIGAASGGNAGRQLLLTNSAAQPIGDGQTIQLFFDTVTQNDFGGAPWDNGTGYLVLPAGSYVLTLTVFFSGGGSAFFFYGYFSTESNLVSLNLNSGNTGAGGFGGTAIPQLFKTDGSANLSMVAYQSGGGGGVSISGPTNYGLSVIQIA